jgi:hypothetical protein
MLHACMISRARRIVSREVVSRPRGTGTAGLVTAGPRQRNRRVRLLGGRLCSVRAGHRPVADSVLLSTVAPSGALACAVPVGAGASRAATRTGITTATRWPKRSRRQPPNASLTKVAPPRPHLRRGPTRPLYFANLLCVSGTLKTHIRYSDYAHQVPVLRRQPPVRAPGGAEPARLDHRDGVLMGVPTKKQVRRTAAQHPPHAPSSGIFLLLVGFPRRKWDYPSKRVSNWDSLATRVRSRSRVATVWCTTTEADCRMVWPCGHSRQSPCGTYPLEALPVL